MRRMVSDHQDVYRVVIVRKHQKKNPDYVEGDFHSPYYVYTDETYEAHYGPYNTIGSAKAILTKETRQLRGGPHPGVAAARIEKAETVWTKVEP